jgi:hypothetical protein
MFWLLHNIFPFNIDSLFTIARDGLKWLHPGQYHIVIGSQRMFTIKLRGFSALWKRFRKTKVNQNTGFYICLLPLELRIYKFDLQHQIFSYKLNKLC